MRWLPWVFLVGCAPVSYERLVGLWATEDDEGNYRALDFAEAGTYELYKYPVDSEPILAQSGSAEIADAQVLNGYEDPQDDVLVFTVEWAEPAAGISPGTSFGNRVLKLSGSVLEIELDPTNGESRVYTAAESLP